MDAKRKRSKPAVKYQGFALEIPLIDKIKKHIKNKPEFRSTTDFVRTAIREKMDRDYKLKDRAIDMLTKKYIKQEIEIALKKQ